MVRVGLIGLGKMGLSHLAMIRVHPDVDLVGVCDTSKFMTDVLEKYTGVATYSDYGELFREAKPEAVIVATPSRFHVDIVRAALERDLHVFCEKPFCLNPEDSAELASMAAARGVVNQVGYHYRFVGAFEEVKRLLEAGAIGRVSHVLAEAYGPVVLRSKGMSWRTRKEEGGGCLYDYAAHPINLLNWMFGSPRRVDGAVLSSIFSADTDDEVYSSIHYEGGPSAQLSVNWSDESFRKMSVRMSIWGSGGRIYADRQECQAYLRSTEHAPAGYVAGWNVRYTTDLTRPVWFYLRGEEYSAQLDYFVRCILSKQQSNINSFAEAADTDRVLNMIRESALADPVSTAQPPKRRSGLFGLHKPARA